MTLILNLASHLQMKRPGINDFSFVVVMGWWWVICHDVDAGVMAPCRFGEVRWRRMCPYQHSGKERAVRWAAVWALSAGQEGEAEVPETNIVSDAVDGTSVDLEDEGVDVPKETAELVKLVSQERVQQRTAQVPMPHSQEETVAVVELAPRERVQQRTVDAPRPQDKNVLLERVSERISEQGGVIEVPETASQDRRLQHTVEQAFVDRAEAVKNCPSGEDFCGDA